MYPGVNMARLRKGTSDCSCEDKDKEKSEAENSVQNLNSGGVGGRRGRDDGIHGGQIWHYLGQGGALSPPPSRRLLGGHAGDEGGRHLLPPSNIITTTAAATTNTNTNVRNITNQQRNKRCCFFWCCCCRCSCIKVRNGGGHKQNNRIDSPPPTIEEIRAWSDSFERLMKCPSGRAAFREFLKCEYSEENILFWLACEELKVENNPAVIEEKARLIYEDYISILSPKEVSLDSRVREIINRNMVDPTPHTFDEAQTQIYTLMHRDSYPRFINSAIYKRLAQLNNNGSSGSSRKESAT